MEGKSKRKNIIIAVIILCILVILGIFLLLNFNTRKEYKVTFIDSIDNSEISTVNVKENSKVERPKDPEREGYIFANWYYENEVYDFNDKVKKDITIEARWEDSKGIILDNYNLILNVGDTKKIEIKSLPQGVTLEDLIWESSDESILSIDKNGNIKALKEGESKVTIKTKNNSYTASCAVKVSKNEIAVESVKITGSTQVKIGSTIKLTANITPSDATDTQVTWESSNSKIATVDKNGNVKGIKEGTVTITVKTNDGGKVATYKVTVIANTTTPSTTKPQEEPKKPEDKKIPVSGVSISGPTEVNVKSSINLKATVTPGNATNKNITWSSDNNSIATVDQSGKVTGVSEGVVNITVKTSDGGYEYTYKVTVNSIYEVYLVKKILTGNEAAYYDITVVKDGNIFSQYDYVQIGDSRIYPGNQVMADSTSNESILEATVMSNGKPSKAKIYYRAYS